MEIVVIPDDQTRVIDSRRNGAARGRGIVEGNVATAAVEEAVLAAVEAV
jgi:hypothetical protein